MFCNDDGDEEDDVLMIWLCDYVSSFSDVLSLQLVALVVE